MKNYWKQKLISENKELNKIWFVLKRDWKKEDEDHENLYRFRVPLSIMAFLCRRLMEQNYLANKESKNYQNMYKKIRVRILKEDLAGKSFYKNTEQMQYPDTFKNKREMQVEFNEICNYIIHESGSSYADDMVSYDKTGNRFIKPLKDVSFFYHVKTHNLRRKFNSPISISWFVQWSGEKSGGVLVDIESLIKAFEKFIELYN